MWKRAACNFYGSTTLILALGLACYCIRPLVSISERDRWLGADFGVSRETSEKVFSQIIKEDYRARDHARRRFPRHVWSQQDDQGEFMRHRIRAIAQSHNLSITQVYLIMDYGSRAHWADAEGRTVSATIVPLNPRLR
jgi:hypothetical protein